MLNYQRVSSDGWWHPPFDGDVPDCCGQNHRPQHSYLLILCRLFGLPSGNQTWFAGKRTIEISDFLIKTSIHRGFSIAMFDYQRVFTDLLIIVAYWAVWTSIFNMLNAPQSHVSHAMKTFLTTMSTRINTCLGCFLGGYNASSTLRLFGSTHQGLSIQGDRFHFSWPYSVSYLNICSRTSPNKKNTRNVE